MRILFFILSAFVLSCSGSPHVKDSSSNTEVIVHYNGAEVYRKNSKYIGEKKVRSLLEERKEFIIIFSSDWCSACKQTRIAIEKYKPKVKIYYLNIDEEWVKQIAATMGVRQIPLMLHLDNKGNTKSVKLGPGAIVRYLLLSF